MVPPKQFRPEWPAAAARSEIAADVFTYPGAGHLYSDASLPDYDAKAADLTWSRVIRFLDAL